MITNAANGFTLAELAQSAETLWARLGQEPLPEGAWLRAAEKAVQIVDPILLSARDSPFKLELKIKDVVGGLYNAAWAGASGGLPPLENPLPWETAARHLINLISSGRGNQDVRAACERAIWNWHEKQQREAVTA